MNLLNLNWIKKNNLIQGEFELKKFLLIFLTCLFIVGCSSEDDTQDNNENTSVEQHQDVEDIGEQSEEEKQGETEEEEKEEEVQDQNVQNEIYSDEVKEFINQFNSFVNSEDIVGPIENVHPIENSDGQYSQILYSSKEYAIYTMYDGETGEVDSYNIVISSDEPYEEGEGKAIHALFYMAATLGIDLDDFAEDVATSIENNGNGMFMDDNYTVMFSGHDDPNIGMLVMFMNLSFTSQE